MTLKYSRIKFRTKEREKNSIDAIQHMLCQKRFVSPLAAILDFILNNHYLKNDLSNNIARKNEKKCN